MNLQAELENALQHRDTLIAVQQAYDELNTLHTRQHELLQTTQQEVESLSTSLKESEHELSIARTEVSALLANQTQDHHQLEELQHHNDELQREIGRIAGLLESRNEEMNNLREELDQISLEREDLAQGLREKHSTLLQVQQELLELHQAKPKLEELVTETIREKDVELEAAKQERDSLASANQSLLHEIHNLQEQTAELRRLIEEKELQISDLRNEIKVHQTREAQLATETSATAQEREEELIDLQRKLSESREIISKVESERALQLAQKDTLLR
jgi:chromosome segregation ATPase